MTARTLIVAALLLAVFLPAMEATVVSTAMPTVIAELGGIAFYGWVGASYLLASTVSVPVFSKLADRRGRKPVLLLGMALFVAGSLASGLAASIHQLLAFRVVQGLGAGAVGPTVLTVVGDLYRPEERGRVQGWFGAVWAGAGIAGPLLGGAIVHAASWRWVFLVNVVPALGSAAVLGVVFHEPLRERKAARLDLPGAAIITLASLAVLLAASGVYPAPLALAAALLGIVFVAVERRAADPVLPLALLRRRVIAVAALASGLAGAVMMAELSFLPLHVQGVLGRPATLGGIVIAPMLVGWPVASWATARLLVRVGYRRPILLGGALIATGVLSLAALIAARAPLVALGAAMLVFGVGMGLVNTAIIIRVQSSVGWEERGVATGVLMFARSMGGALGVGALGALMAASLARDVPLDVASALLDPHRRAVALGHPGVVEALTGALGPIFAVAAGLGVLNMLLLLIHPRDEAAAGVSLASSAPRA